MPMPACVQHRIPDQVMSEQYFRRALDINPNFPEALYQMAQLSYDQQNYLQARAFIERFNSADAVSRARKCCYSPCVPNKRSR